MPTKPPIEESVELVPRLEQVMSRLGFADRPGLIRRWADYNAVTSCHVVRQAFDTIRVHAVFGFPSSRSDQSKTYTPILYFAISQDH